MKFHAKVQVRGYQAKYPVWISREIETSSEELGVVLVWEWARKLKGTRGPHKVLAVVLKEIE